MISETAFINCKNVPADMRSQFDKPWHFVGEVLEDTPTLICDCHKCTFNLRTYLKKHRVYMPGHQFITDDMLLVIVFFGVCGACGTVHWARSGAPFKRVRSCVPV